MLSKNSRYNLIAAIIAVAVLNIVFFSWFGATKNPASVWISYGFIHFSLVSILVTACLGKKYGNVGNIAATLQLTSVLYFISEFIAGVVFIILRQKFFQIALTVQIVMAGLYAIGVIYNLKNSDLTLDQTNSASSEKITVKLMESKLKSLLRTCEDEATKGKLEQAYELVKSSPVAASNSTNMTEETMNETIREIEAALKGNDYESAGVSIDNLIDLANERNDLLKVSL